MILPLTANSYYNQLNHPRFKQMSRAEETAAFLALRAGDRRQEERIVQANMRFLRSVAFRYKNQGMEFEDLINAGAVGMVKALRRFDPARGIKFISYAVWWVRQSILSTMAEQSYLICLPPSQFTLIRKMAKLKMGLEQALGRAPSLEEVAAGLREQDRKRGDLQAAYEVLPQFFTLPSMDVLREAGFEPASHGPSPAAGYEDALDRRRIQDMMEGLKPMEREVLRRHYGFHTGRCENLEEIAQDIGLTRERIRQIKEKALVRVRKRATAMRATDAREGQ